MCQNIDSVKNSPVAYWTCNLDAIYDNLHNIYNIELYGNYKGTDVQLILGGNSFKYQPDTFEKVFPNLSKEHILVIPGAGHWVQAEKPEETIRGISDFLLELDSSDVYASGLPFARIDSSI